MGRGGGWGGGGANRLELIFILYSQFHNRFNLFTDLCISTSTEFLSFKAMSVESGMFTFVFEHTRLKIKQKLIIRRVQVLYICVTAFSQKLFIFRMNFPPIQTHTEAPLINHKH